VCHQQDTADTTKTENQKVYTKKEKRFDNICTIDMGGFKKKD